MEFVQWVTGIAVTILIAMVGFMINALTRLSQKQSSDMRDVYQKIDTVKAEYVRRDDFKEFKVELRETLDRIEGKTDKIIDMQKTH